MATKVLIAEDEEDVRDVMELFLESQGYEVETAYDGLDALDRVKTWKPDVVLMDIMMPVKDGIEVCREVKADPDTRDIPIIMVSAAGKREKEGEARDAGASAYILKPYEPSQLVEMIEKCVGGAGDGG